MRMLLAGLTLWLIAAWLYGVQFLAAGAYGSGVELDGTIGEQAFRQFRIYIDGPLPTLSLVCLVVGTMLVLAGLFGPRDR